MALRLVYSIRTEGIRDLLHSIIINTASQMFLRRRDILEGVWNKDKSVAISFDCDYDSDLIACRHLLPLLNEERTPCSFAISGFLVKRFPNFIPIIANRTKSIGKVSVWPGAHHNGSMLIDVTMSKL